MAQQAINVGTAANDGTGDSIRAAFQKINANDTELYAAAAGKVDTAAIDTDSTMAANSDSKIPSQKAVKAALAALVNAAPSTLDTLKELADALGDDANFATTVTTALAGKQPLDSDLTAIASLTTAALGRSLLTGATAADIFALLGVGAWTAYTPVVTSTTGAITAASATGAYVVLGKLVLFRQILTITTIGTAGGEIRGSLPHTVAAQLPCLGVFINSGKSLCSQVFSNYSFSHLYDGSFPFGDGSVLSVSGFYEIA
jgi:hypothetical protein